MSRLRKPDKNVLTPEDYKKYSKLYEEGKDKQEIKDALEKSNKEAAEREKQANIDYQKKQQEQASPYKDATKYDVLEGYTPETVTGEAVTTYKDYKGNITTTKPSAVTGWESMIATIVTAFNPFDDDKIVATMGGKTFKSVAEFVANHPYMIALAATGVTGIIKAITAKAATIAGYTIGESTPSIYAVNTATAKLTGNYLVKSGFSLIAASTIAATIGGTYPFARFEIAETMDKLGMARWKAYEAGDKDSMEALDALQDEVLNPVGWENVLRNLPFTNVYTAVTRNIQAAEASRKVFNKLIENDQIAKENGEDEDAKWERVRQQELDAEKEATDYYNAERKKQLLWENELYQKQQEADAEAYEESREEQRKLDKEAREKEAAFWAEQRKKQRELEAADRKAIAEFWLAYKKQSQKLADESRPSQLNFGIL